MIIGPLTQKSFESLVKPWLEVVNKGESASVLNLSKRSQVYRINQLLNDRKTLKKYLKKPDETQLLQIHSSTLTLDNLADFERYIEKFMDKTKKRFVFFILDADSLLIDHPEAFAFFNLLTVTNSAISLLFFFSKNITLDHYAKKLSSFSSVFQNIVIIPLLDNQDINQFISYLESHSNIFLPKTLKKQIIDQCGSKLWLITQVVRYFAKTKDDKKIFDNDEFLFRLRLVWEEYDAVEKSTLIKVVKNDYSFNTEEKVVVKYLLKTRLLKKTGDDYQITVPVLAEYIKDQLNQANQITTNDKKQLVINGLVLEGYFSRREKRLLNFLIINSGKTVSREKIASIIWGQDSEERYTDWALDQIIKRLRDKFVKLGLNAQLIKTKKNQGFIYQG